MEQVKKGWSIRSKAAFVMLIAFLLALGLHFYLLDGLQGELFWFITYNEDTVYAPGYSDWKFRKIKLGMPAEEVRSILGEPLKLYWEYDWTQSGDLDCSKSIHFDENKVRYLSQSECSECLSLYAQSGSYEKFKKLSLGMTVPEVAAIVGTPIRETWAYSKSPGGHSYRIRHISLENKKVVNIFYEFYVD